MTSLTGSNRVQHVMRSRDAGQSHKQAPHILTCLLHATHGVQFEDPSPNLQRLREKVDLEMMLATPWVVELAQQQVN